MARTVSPLGAINWAHPLNRGLTAWWLHLPGDVRAFTRLNLLGDLEASSYTVAAPTKMMTAGPPGLWGAWDFTNSALTDRVGIPGGFTTLISGQAVNTVAMWVLARSFANTPVFLGHDAASTTWFHEFTTGGALYWGHGAAFRTYSAPVCTVNKWCHLVFSKTGSGDSGSLYMDGVLTTSYTGTIGTTPTETRDMWIGNYNSAGLGLDGRIDDLRIYSARALTDEEAWNLYTESRLGYPTALKWSARRSFATTISTFDAATFPYLPPQQQHRRRGHVLAY